MRFIAGRQFRLSLSASFPGLMLRTNTFSFCFKPSRPVKVNMRKCSLYKAVEVICASDGCILSVRRLIGFYFLCRSG